MFAPLNNRGYFLALQIRRQPNFFTDEHKIILIMLNLVLSMLLHLMEHLHMSHDISTYSGYKGVGTRRDGTFKKGILPLP